MRGNTLLTLLLSPSIYCLVLYQERCWIRFNVSSICEHSYGNWITQVPYVPTVGSCGGHCLTDDACNSFMFSPSSRTCQTNSQIATAVPTTCSSSVLYAELDKFGCRYVDLNEPCSFNVICNASHSLCIDGVCRCQIGYSFHPGNNTCVKLCLTYGAEFTRHGGFWLNTPYKVAIAGQILRRQCADMCMAEATFVCRVYLFDTRFTNTPCRYTNETFLTKPDDFKTANKYSMSVYQRHCA